MNSTMNPAVTVLMAVYDPPIAMLEQAMDSIQSQTFADFEFLIVDDGSRDPAVRGFLAQRAKGDARIRILTEPHRGLTASLNRGLALARGTWIARQDADDWSEPTRLECQVGLLPGASRRPSCSAPASGPISRMAVRCGRCVCLCNTPIFCAGCRAGIRSCTGR